MKKYNLSKIMKRAWELKKEDNKNIFSICLQMAWEEAKKGENKMNAEETLKNLQKDLKKESAKITVTTKRGIDELYYANFAGLRFLTNGTIKINISGYDEKGCEQHNRMLRFKEAEVVEQGNKIIIADGVKTIEIEK